MPQLAALGIQPPQINALGAFQQGQAQALGLQQREQQMQQSQQTHASNMQNAEINRKTAEREQALQGLQLIGSIAMGAMGGDLRGQVDPQKFDQGLDILQGYGVDVEQFRGKPELAPVVAQSSLTALQRLQAAQSDREYDLALQKFDLDVMEAMAPGGNAKGSLGSPVWGTDNEGNPIAMQVTENGELRQLRTPDGAELSTGVDKVDLGTSWGLLDKRSGEMIGTLPKDVEGEKAAEVRGKATGEAQTNLDVTLEKADQGIALIDQMLEHPGLDTAVGLSSIIDPRNYVAGTEANDFNVMSSQLKGKAFLQAFESLKGGGAITEVEGQAATEAIARLNQSQSEEAYKEALLELRGILEKGKRRATQKASSTGTEASNVSEISTQKEYESLPSGARFTWRYSNGETKTGIKP